MLPVLCQSRQNLTELQGYLSLESDDSVPHCSPEQAAALHFYLCSYLKRLINTMFHFFSHLKLLSIIVEAFGEAGGKIGHCPQVKVIPCSFIIYSSDNRMESVRLWLTQPLKKPHFTGIFYFVSLNADHI